MASSNEDYMPDFSESDIETQPFSDIEPSEGPSSIPPIASPAQPSFEASNSPSLSRASSSKVIEPKYNLLEYRLPISKAYIFKVGLFSQSLLPIQENKDREMRIECTT